MDLQTNIVNRNPSYATKAIYQNEMKAALLADPAILNLRTSRLIQDCVERFGYSRQTCLAAIGSAREEYRLAKIDGLTHD